MVKFTIGGLNCALPVVDVQEISAMVWVTPMPGAGSHVLGVIDCHGTPCPVVDIRHLLNLPAADIDPEQQLLVLRLGAELLAVPCDRAETVLWGQMRTVTGEGVKGQVIQGLIQEEDGVTLVLDSAHLLNGAPMGKGKLRQLTRGVRVMDVGDRNR